MNPLFLALLGIVVLAGLAGYALYRAATPDVPTVLTTAARALPVLVLGAMALVLVDPANIPSVLRAVMPK
ncbi:MULTISPECIES: hypothetical protein [unclassified Streptomyces]|uniref:hypothetical protein n=1 Tax=unclassified Streptomyces TaxID=2593676 RepID=UPI002E36D942|nr:MULTISPECIES: hypothetical protein [unclassified Streptomyces]WUC69175.1 hypothetical protein OG861_33575 [Streptomyces sp. NBC_00539]